MHIWNVMTSEVITVSPDDKLSIAQQLMDERHFRRLPVVQNGALVGIITDRDMRKHAGYLDVTRVNAAMTPNPLTISPRVTAEDAARLMLDHKIGGLPVIENGKLVGIVTTTDVMKAFLRVVQASLDVLKP